MAVSAAILPARMCGNSDQRERKSHAAGKVYPSGLAYVI